MNTRELLLALLRYELSGDAPSAEVLALISSDEAEAIYALAKKHEVIAMAAHAMISLGVKTTQEMALKLQKQMMVAKHYYECMNYEISEIGRVLSDAGIEHILLKGATLRMHYPIPWLRTSCDVDILVREERLEDACAILTEKLAYKQSGRTPHDIPFYAPSGVHVELHFTLLESEAVDEREAVLCEVWERTLSSEDKFRLRMTDEMFYYYHIVHMVKHFVTGGCGIRPFLDLWILTEKVSHDKAKREALLERGGMKKFAEASIELMRIWLEGTERTERSDMMENYIMYGGVYGNTENKVAVQQSKKGGKFSYAISRVFPPYRLMAHSYPILLRRKWLLPFMYVRRWGRVVRRGRLSASITELKYNDSISEAQKNQTQKFLSDIGL